VSSVRVEGPDDHAAVHEVHVAAFGRPVEADLLDALRADGDLVPELSLVAEQDGVIVGHVAFSRASVADGIPVLVLGPVGVRPEHQRRGIGAALIREGLERAAATDAAFVVLLGHPAYYPRFGFEPAASFGLRAPVPVPPQAWMARPLPARPRGVAGVVAWARAFTDLG
jgi:putative acetyltransferase